MKKSIGAVKASVQSMIRGQKTSPDFTKEFFLKKEGKTNLIVFFSQIFALIMWTWSMMAFDTH